MGRGGSAASAVALAWLAAAGLWVGIARAQDVTEGLRPAISTDPATDTTTPGVLRTQSQLPLVEEPVRRKRAPVTDDAYLGIGTSTLRLYPAVEIGAIASSNADDAKGGAGEDIGFRIAPSLRLQSNWSRHEWTVQGNGGLEYFPHSDTFATSTADFATRFRLDIRRDTRADFTAGYTLEQSSDNTSEFEQDFSATAGLARDFGGIETQLRLGVSRSIFGDSSSDEDFTEPAVSGRATLSPGGSLRPFVEVSYAPRFHDQRLDRNGLQRDSVGGTIAVGVTVDRSPFLAGEVAALYSYRNYDDPALSSADGAGLQGSLAWTPTDFTQATATAGFTLDETTEATASAVRTWTGALTFAHAMREDVSVFGGVDAEVEDGAGPADITLGSHAGLSWQMNPYAAWALRYENSFFIGGGSDDDYDEHRVIGSLILRR